MTEQKLIEYFDKNGNPVIVLEPQTKKEKRGAGRPEHEPNDETRKIVTNLASLLLSYTEIATALSISYPTLKKYYEEELKSGLVKRKVNVRNDIFAEAKKRKSWALKWVDACYFGAKPGAAAIEPDDEMTGGSTVIQLVDGNTPDKDRNEI